MDPRITYLHDGLHARRADLVRTVAHIPDDLRETAPAGGGWSVAAVLEHLADTERRVTGLLASMLPGAAPRDPAEPWVPDAFARHVDLPALLDRSRRFTGTQPPGKMGATEALTALDGTRAALLAVLEGAGGRRLEDLSYQHPFAGNLDLYQWIAFVGLHEARHVAQIREIAARLAAPAA